jgi:hypothetical protein
MDFIGITRFTFLNVMLVIERVLFFPWNVLKKTVVKMTPFPRYNNPSMRIPGGCARNKALSASKREFLSQKEFSG